MKILLLALALFAGTAQAFKLPKYKSLGEFVNAEMKTQSNYMSDYENISDSELSMDSSFYLNVIRLRLRAIIGLEVPLFASVELSPFLELRWKRKLPKDMVKYQPGM